MIRRIVSFLCLLGAMAVIAMNFHRILSFGQSREVEQSARKAIAAQNWEHALQIYEQGHQRYPDNPEISRRLARLYDRAGQPQRAIKTYRAILSKDPGDSEAIIGLVSILRRDPGKLDNAIVETKKGLKLHPRHAELLYTLGSLYQNIGDQLPTSGALPPTPDTAVTRANPLWFYQQARYYYELSLKIHPQHFQALFNLGVVQQRIRNLQPAAKAYCQALLLHPDSVEARYNLGLTLSMLDYQDHAYRQMDRAIQILTEQGDIPTAQRLALKVQAVKNRVYARRKNTPTLSTEPDPPFLPPACLRIPERQNND